MVDLASGLVPDSILALHGVAAEGIVVGTGGDWADGLDETSDITAFELSGAAYERLDGTFSVERLGDEWILFVEGFSAVDLSDSASRIGVWLATAGGDLVGFEDDPGAPTGSYLPAWPDGVAVRPVRPVILTGGGEPDTSGSTAGQVWTSTGDGDPAAWATPSPGGSSLGWEDDGAYLATYLIDGGAEASIVKPVLVGAPAAPVVDTGPASVLVGVVQTAHRPAGNWQGTAAWFYSGLGTGLLDVFLDVSGGTLGTAGGLWVQDATGTLTTGDDVKIDLGSVWWPVVTP